MSFKIIFCDASFGEKSPFLKFPIFSISNKLALTFYQIVKLGTKNTFAKNVHAEVIFDTFKSKIVPFFTLNRHFSNH